VSAALLAKTPNPNPVAPVALLSQNPANPVTHAALPEDQTPESLKKMQFTHLGKKKKL